MIGVVYHFKVHKAKDGYWAECSELRGCLAQAHTRPMLKRNASEALNLYLDELEGSTAVFLLPRKHPGKGIMEVAVDPGIALSMLLRRASPRSAGGKRSGERWLRRVRARLTTLAA